MSDKTLLGKTVFITGASRGIGKAMALKLASAGANIVIAAKSVQEDPRLGGTIFSAAAEVEALGVKALALSADVADINSINSAVEKALAQFKSIDILINSAGIASFGKFLELEPEAWERIIQVNLFERKLLRSLFVPDKKWRKQEEPQLRFFL